MQVFKKSSSAMPIANAPVGASLPMDTRVTLLEAKCKALQERLQMHEELLESIFRPDGSIELKATNKLEIVAGASRITIDMSGIRIQSPMKVRVDASIFDVNASTVPLNAGSVSTPGTITCQTIRANSVVGSSYTPGAGNLW